MSYNRTLVAGASSVVVALGAVAPKLFPNQSPACLDAIKKQASDTMISLACGPSFDNGDLVLMFLLGGAVFLGITFWSDISQFLWEKTNSQSTS